MEDIGSLGFPEKEVGRHQSMTPNSKAYLFPEWFTPPMPLMRFVTLGVP
jgi:hypothetical protein